MKRNTAVEHEIEHSPDPYSESIATITSALRAGIRANGRMNDHEYETLCKLHNLLISLDPHASILPKGTDND